MLQRIAAGDQQAFSILFNTYWNNIYSVALVLSKSTAIAEDVVQEIFLKVWKKRAELAGIERFEDYL